MSESALTHTDPSDIKPSLMSPVQPHVIVLFGAMGSTRWRPRSPGSAVVALESDGGESSKVMDISADQVIAAWRALPATTLGKQR